MLNSKLFESDSTENSKSFSIHENFSFNLNSRDLKFVKILNEQWVYPLKGFMNESQYFQAVHFKYLKIEEKIFHQPIPIVLSLKEHFEESLIKKIKQINLIFNQKIIGFMNEFSFFQDNQIDEVKSAEWLLGGNLIVPENITIGDDLEMYRYSPSELKSQCRNLNADIVVAFFYNCPINKACGLFLKNFTQDLICKGYKNPVLLLINTDSDKESTSYPVSVILEQQSAILELYNLKFICSIIPSPFTDQKQLTELQWISKLLLSIGVDQLIVCDKKNSVSEKKTKQMIKLVTMSPGLENIKIQPYFIDQSMDITSLKKIYFENKVQLNETMNQKAYNILENYFQNFCCDSYQTIKKCFDNNEKRFILMANARSGSTFLASLLRCHYQVGMKGELLNGSIDIADENIFTYLNKSLISCNKPIIGFKVLNDQIAIRNIKSENLLRSIKANFAIILWRQDILDCLVSNKIAETTNKWYKSKYEKGDFYQVDLEESEILNYYEQQMSQWRFIAKFWPVEVEPYFLTYEDLIKNPIIEAKKALAYMLLDPENQDYESDSDKMNPKSLPEKVKNWNQLSDKVKMIRLNVREIFEQEFYQSLKINNNKIHLLPDREPKSFKGIVYRVSEPYISQKSLKYINQSLKEKSISSASPWPRILANKLKALYQVPTAFPCSNGFTALILALQLAEIKPNDQVICPSFTMIAVANSIRFLNAIPIFVDNANGSYNPDWNEIKNKISTKTKAVIICHTLGVPLEFKKLKIIIEECKKRNIFLIEDISECVGIRIKTDDDKTMFLGSFGNFACASLYANKIVNCGDGGFVLSKCYSDQTKLESIINHGFTNSYHFVHFRHSINGKINGMAAAFALGSFESLDFIIENRKHLTNLYRTELSGIKCIKTIPLCGYMDTVWVFGIECENKDVRKNLRKHLMDNGIETRDYFFPLHLQPAFSDLYDSNLDFSNCERLASVGFYLPTYTDLKDSQVKYIVSKIYEYFHIPYSVSFNSMDENDTINESFLSVEFNAQSFDLDVLKIYPSGNKNQFPKMNIFNYAVSLKHKMDGFFKKNNLIEPHLLLYELKQLLKNSKDYPQIEKYFRPCVIYLEEEIKHEFSPESPWLNQVYEKDGLQHIPTTTDAETLQLLYWLVKTKLPANVLELGCWLGHASLLMAYANNQTKVYGVDNFQWQFWMNDYVNDNDISLNSGESFKKYFEKYTRHRQNQIKTVRWTIDMKNMKLPDELENVQFDLVFLDFTKNGDEIERYWLLIRMSFIPGKTIIVLNGVDQSLCGFINKYRHELKILYRPKNKANVYIFKSYEFKPHDYINFDRKFNFLEFNEFNHLNDDVYTKCIDLLKEKYHQASAEIFFIPAVEVTICDDPLVLNSQKWIGIIHSCIENTEHFYVPDLEKLCTERYDHLMKNCLGLFTLTTQQAEYLRRNLKYKIPIQTLVYPFFLNDKKLFDRNIELYEPVNLTFIGNFARDYDFFFKVISNNMKIKKISLAPNEKSKEKIEKFNKLSEVNNIEIIERLNEVQYEELLSKSVVFLSLKHQGAANTIILECIARNVPILVPNIPSCTEYIGEEYPLLYEPNNFDLSGILTWESVNSSIFYLKNMNKKKFSPESFMINFSTGIVLKSIGPQIEHFSSHFDISICICSYKRTENLRLILENLWSRQNFALKYEIIVWNNNYSRKNLLQNMCEKYIRMSCDRKSLKLINSSTNYYCSIRFSLANLIKSNKLLICDDDIMPKENYINFFYSNSQIYPNDVLCSRGHIFLPHKLDPFAPEKVWQEYENLRFVGDEKETQSVHFVHADTCLIPKQALNKCCSVSMADQGFNLVDDYWMSYVLNGIFKINLRKLKITEQDTVFERTEDSDTVGLALHTRPEVKDVRNRFYIYHMLNGWPEFVYLEKIEYSGFKRSQWKQKFVGFNINSKIFDSDIEYLKKMGINCARIGAVGLGDEVNFEFSGLNTNKYETLCDMENLVKKLLDKSINLVITLDNRLATVENWIAISEKIGKYKNVIGYDLINEPFTPTEIKLSKFDLAHFSEINEIESVVQRYKSITIAIRKYDQETPVIVEPTFWSNCEMLDLLVESLEKDKKFFDSMNTILSFHFYEPKNLTFTSRNHEKYVYPGYIPKYLNVKYDKEYWNDEAMSNYIRNQISKLTQKGYMVFVGEFGINRCIQGAKNYLECGLDNFNKLNVSVFLFRDPFWDKMNYEFGTDNNNKIRLPDNENELFSRIKNMIKKINTL